MSSHEFAYWYSFNEIEPPNNDLMWAIAGLRSDIWNASGNMKRGEKAKPTDFMPKLKQKPLTPEQSVELLRKALGG